MNMEGDIMEKCPNCKNSLCVNPYFTQTLNFLDLMIESNLFELESSEEYMLMEFILSEDFIKRHKKPRTIPSKVPRRLPRQISNNIIYGASEENFIEYSGAISVTCKNSEFVFEYADEDLEYLDN